MMRLVTSATTSTTFPWGPFVSMRRVPGSGLCDSGVEVVMPTFPERPRYEASVALAAGTNPMVQLSLPVTLRRHLITVGVAAGSTTAPSPSAS